MQSIHHIEEKAEPRILEASKRFARTIVESPQFRQFDEASRRLRNDPSAQQLLSDFQQAQQLQQMMQSWGGTPSQEADRLNQAKHQMLSNPTLKQYFESQDEMLLILKELNLYMTEKLGFDFAGLAKP
ncbi:MAG: YlbF family regulator, partial [Bacteroidota bacterium]